VQNSIRKNTPSAEDNSKLLDTIGWKILDELQHNGRIPFTELGKRVGLSTPAVMERVHRLEEAGIILGYGAELDRAKVGYPVLAFIRVNVVGDSFPRIMKVSRDLPQVLECHRVTGTDSFIMKVALSSVDELERLIDNYLTPFVATTTSLVMSTSVNTRVLVRPQGGGEKLERLKSHGVRARGRRSGTKLGGH
jgi:Lrp/AsnC family leucine-responsive transcriptional regulator